MRWRSAAARATTPRRGRREHPQPRRPGSDGAGRSRRSPRPPASSPRRPRRSGPRRAARQQHLGVRGGRHQQLRSRALPALNSPSISSAPVLIADAFASALPKARTGSRRKHRRPAPGSRRPTTCPTSSRSRVCSPRRGRWPRRWRRASASMPSAPARPSPRPGRIRRISAAGPDPVPLGHGPALAEFDRTILYLAETRSITGQMIALDGGQHLAWRDRRTS